MHTEASDGSNSIEQMAAAAQDVGYAYIGISDHSQSLKIAGGFRKRSFGHKFEKSTNLMNMSMEFVSSNQPKSISLRTARSIIRTLGGHPKTGHLWSLQNRPLRMA
jgi:histidinol phosphatase-like PHP family hydrolase